MVTFVNSLYKPDLHEPQQKRKKINVAFSPLRLRGGGKEDGDESDDENEGNSFQGEAIWNESQKDITDETMQSTTPKQGDRVKRRSSSCSGRIEGSICYILVIVIICVTSSLLHHTDITWNRN